VSPRVVGLRAEHHRDPLGIGSASPRLSWRVESGRPGWIQSGYEIDVDSTVSTVEGPDQVLVPWPAAPLESRQRRTVRVRVRGRDDGDPSPWSDPLVVEAGLLLPGDWTARMIGPAAAPEAGVDGPAVLLRRDFDLPAEPVGARLYVTAHGVYELELNGARVGDHVLAPGWTSYRNRLRYQTFDVTGLLRAGANAIGGWLADGWFRGRLGFGGGRRDVYGDRTGLLAQLEVTCADGSTVVVGTGEDWRTAPGPVVATGLYDGDRHVEQPPAGQAGLRARGARACSVAPRRHRLL
jgi:alpha-L-rhamnosidase